MRIKLKQDKDTIMRILASDDVERKLRVLDKLDGVNEKDSIKILIKTLEDTSWCMREKAAHRLATYGSRISARLARLLTKGYWYTRASACLALGEIADMRTVAPVVKVLLNDENPTVMKEASNALVNMASRKPQKFVQKLSDMELPENALRNVLFSLEQNDIDLYQKIKDLLVDERNT